MFLQISFPKKEYFTPFCLVSTTLGWAKLHWKDTDSPSLQFDYSLDDRNSTEVEVLKVFPFPLRDKQAPLISDILSSFFSSFLHLFS